ncbi:hypothetical protein [Lentibacillus halodurans]|nr:hypothetical protein [Lentibacillus halodurans]
MNELVCHVRFYDLSRKCIRYHLIQTSQEIKTGLENILNPGNVLIFGGTGMLAEATGWIAAHANHTIAFERNRQRLDLLKKKYGEHELEVKKLDYTDTLALENEIKHAHMQHNTIIMFGDWIHSTAPTAIQTIKTMITKRQTHQP